MKNLYFLIIFILATAISYAQKEYTADGDLQFINPDGGFIIKKEGVFYRLVFDTDNAFVRFRVKKTLEPLNAEEYDDYSKNEQNIYPKDINGDVLKQLDQNTFKTLPEDPENPNSFTLRRFNRDLFSLSECNAHNKNCGLKDLLAYIVINFGNGKKAVQFFNDKLMRVVSVKKKLVFMSGDDDTRDAFAHYSTTAYRKPEARDFYMNFVGDAYLNDRIYRTDTLANGKILILSFNNELAIDKSFDSIDFNEHFIVGYKNKKPIIYNYTFKELTLPRLKVVHLTESFPMAQVIQGNKLKYINPLGGIYKYSDGPGGIDLSHHFDPKTFTIKVTKTDGHFFLNTDDYIYDVIPKINFMTPDIGNMYHTEAYDSIQYMGDYHSITLNTESGYKKKLPFLLYAKRKDGKYDLNTLEYLLINNTDTETVAFNNALPKNIDKIIPRWDDDFFIEKNGLFTWYPIMKEIKYKKLGQFNGYYARYELPDGKKGWLSLDGKEYPDE